VTQKIFDFNVIGTSHGELLYLFREIFIDPQYEFKIGNETPRIIDCGANIGMATLFFKRKFPNCKILAFEPNPKVFELLKRNIDNNGIMDVEIINAGLSDEDGTMDLYIDRENSLISSIEKIRGGEGSTKVNAMRLSKFVEGKKFDFAKIDIEGAESKVVKDLVQSQTLQNIDQYVFEYHHNMTGSDFRLSDFLTVFEKNGFAYNLKTSFREIGDFQDILITFFKKQGNQ
jgi:FkbM family methyltransferase